MLVILAGFIGTSCIIRAILRGAVADKDTSGFRNESAYLFSVVSNLNLRIIDDNRPLQTRRVRIDKVYQTVERHSFQIDILLFDDVRTSRNYLISPIDRFSKNLPDIFFSQF